MFMIVTRANDFPVYELEINNFLKGGSKEQHRNLF